MHSGFRGCSDTQPCSEREAWRLRRAPKAYIKDRKFNLVSIIQSSNDMKIGKHDLQNPWSADR